MTGASSQAPTHVPQTRVFDFDYANDARFATADPHAALLDLPDIFYAPRHGGHWVFRRFDVIQEILRDTELFTSQSITIPYSPDRPRFVPIELDPPYHAKYRAIVQ